VKQSLEFSRHQGFTVPRNQGFEVLRFLGIDVLRYLRIKVADLKGFSRYPSFRIIRF
jgi:hypothetical protein